MALICCRSRLLAGLRLQTSLGASCISSSSHVRTPRRPYFASSLICRDEQSSTHNRPAAPADADVAVNNDASKPGPVSDVARRLYSLQRYLKDAYQGEKGGYVDHSQLVREAWNLLQSIPEAEVDRMPTRDLAEIVNTYNYFASFWENGMDGPANASSSGSGRGFGAAAGAKESAAYKPLFDYALVDRPDAVGGGSGDSRVSAAAVRSTVNEVDAPPKRANPLDEILDF